MTISINQARVEDLQKLSVFFEFISNLQSYKDFLAETRATLDRMESVVNAHTSVVEAEGYLTAAAAKLARLTV